MVTAHGSPAPGRHQDPGRYPPIPLQEAKANWNADSLLSIEKTISRKEATADADDHNGPKSSKSTICKSSAAITVSKYASKIIAD